MFAASQTTILQQGTTHNAQQFIDQLAPQLPTQIQCIQLTNPQTGNIVASTCETNRLIQPKRRIGGTCFNKPINPANSRQLAYTLRLCCPNKSPIKAIGLSSSGQAHQQGQLKLLLSTPVYDLAGQIRYALSIQSTCQKKKLYKPGSLAGYTVVIDQSGLY
jgi:hypothetical protein